METNNNSKITPAAALGELQRVLKLYEAFKDAEKILAVLVEREQYKKELDKEVSTAETRLGVIIQEIEDAIAKSEKQLADLAAFKKLAEKDADDLKKKAWEYLDKARQEAREIVAKAHSEVASFKDQIEKLRSEKQAALEETDKAKAILANVTEEIEKKRNQILQVFK